jgi:Ca2+-binding EF-hand superfamily protein
MQSLGIYNNPHTVHTLPSVNSKNNQQNVYVKNLIAAATEEQELAERIKQQESDLAEKEKIENMIIEFSKKSRELNAFLESAEEFLGDPITATSIQDAEKLISEFNQFETQFQSRGNDHTELVAHANSMKEANITDFSGTTIEDITAKWNTIATGIEERKTAVHAELERQKNNDALSHEFADSANDFSQFIQKEKEQVAQVKGELEEQREAVAAIQRDYESSGKERLNSLEAINQKAQVAGIKNNPYTQFTVRSLEVQFNELNEGMNKQLKLLDSEILQKKNADVTPEQLEEFKQTFRHFDKDQSGFLNRHEFKACLQTLGDDTSESELDKIMNTIGKDGKISFEAFTKFMVDRNKDSTTSDEILESFKSLANDKDFVTPEDLRKVMSNEHAEFLLARMPPYEAVPNGYDYKKWVQKVYSS